MLKYIAKRIGLALITIFTVATLTFFLMNMVPGGPFLSEKAVSPAAQAALEAKYGLDKPLSQQYLTYMKDALHGDFGESLKQRGRTVTSIIVSKFPVSARVGGLSVIVALLVGIPLGCLAATHRGKTLDSVISVISTCGIAVPSFVVCTLLLYFLGSKVKILPTYGIGTWKHYVMPVIALALYPNCLYYETDAFFHAGCSGAGLYENRYGEGSKTFLPSVQACTEKCTAPRYHLCRSYDGLYYDRKLRSREDFHDPRSGQ